MVEVFSLGVGGELEEELLQPGTVRGPQLDEWDARLVSDVPDSEVGDSRTVVLMLLLLRAGCLR